MFAMAYEKSGLGRRIALGLLRALGKSTLRLGIAAALAEAVLAIVTPSNTARGAGTVFPVLINVPPLYDSKPNEPSRRRIGAYLLFTAFASNTITSTLFVTGCAPNFLALDFARKLANVQVSWFGWFKASAPFALPLLLLTPVLLYFIYPPQVKRNPESAAWAADRRCGLDAADPHRASPSREFGRGETGRFHTAVASCLTKQTTGRLRR